MAPPSRSLSEAEWKPRIASSAGTPPFDQGARSSPLASTSAKLSPSGPSKCRRFSPKLVSVLRPVDALFLEALLPVAERSLGHREDGRADLADAGAALADVRKREIGHHRARRAEFVRVVEMVDVRCVEVDGLLDPAQPELAGEEFVVLTGILRHRGDVVKALDLIEHFRAPCWRRALPLRWLLCGPSSRSP